MIVYIHISEMDPSIRESFLKNEIKHLSIDYAYNSIMGFIGDEEIKVFEFTKYFKADNRYNSYNLHRTLTDIILEITPSDLD